MPNLAPLLAEAKELVPSPGERDVRDRLDRMIVELREAGIPDSVTLRVMMSWAAEKAYEGGGYGVAKGLTLNALEDLLFRASR